MEISELQNSITNPTDPEQSESLLNFIDEIMATGDYDEKGQLVEYLSSLLSRKGQEIESANPSIYESLQSKWLNLAFSAFLVLEASDQDSLLQKKIFTAIQKGFEPDDIINKYFSFYETDEFVKAKFHHFMEALDQNTETLGSLPIEVEGKRMLPNIKYWLLDYSKFPSKNARRGSVERLNYLTQSANVRQLTQGQRQNLSKLLKFYDDLIAGERPLNYQDRRDEKPLTSARINIPVPRPINIDQKLDELKERVQK